MVMQSSRPRRETPTVAGAGGMTTTGALTILFVALKLCGVITWSWWWILSPVWIVCTVMVLALCVLVACALVEATREERERDRRWRQQHRKPQAHQHGPAHRWGRRP